MKQAQASVKEVIEKSEVAKREEAILEFWREHDIFNKTIKTPAQAEPVGEFVFYDGPPFATGTPHYGHILAGTIKDAIPRFQTMRGKRVLRKWGWDCHGLPLENIIEKRLGLATKRDIEALGVKRFNEAAREAVMEYAHDWKRIIPRLGRFVDMENDYRTMDATYTESVWWVLRELSNKGLVYEGFKSMHLCPRCGTTLSNFEVNQGYKDIKDIAVTVKLPLLQKDGSPLHSSLLVWTTTPWTLPGNMAAAVHKEIEYVEVKVKTENRDEHVILAKERIAQLGTHEYEVLRTMKGEELLGTRYEPPFGTFKERAFTNKDNAWQIYHADYVELGDEGTGAVHIAPAYGDEDMALAKERSIPIEHHVDTDGRFMNFVEHLAGQLVKPKDDEKADVSHLDADIEVVKRLRDSGKLLRKENITHSYPHCWRCGTPLLNYATTSWFVEVTKIKEELIKENKKVVWIPEYVGTNRFGKWLENARDWAISRQRYWGAPLPIWKNPVTRAYTVVGSLKELQSHMEKSGNTYFLMRHAEAESNERGVISSRLTDHNPLTEKGRSQVTRAIEDLRGKNIDLIIASPFARTKETAERTAEGLGIPLESIVYDERLGEISLGYFEGKTVEEYHEFLSESGEWQTATPLGGESWSDVKQRVGAFLYATDAEYRDKNILIVSHNSPLRMLTSVMEGASLNGRDFDHDENGKRYGNAEVREHNLLPFPHNDAYELDFHRPFIDEIVLRDEDGTIMERVPDVFDCWFESGSMPYAENHYPFEHTDLFDPAEEKGFPADFISEGIDQTRGWFYSLMVLGVALTGKSPYKHVITNGLVLAEDGLKMSKSLQNYPDPMDIANTEGADALRYYLLSSPVIRGEDFRFSEKEVREGERKNIGRLHNVLAMYEQYKNGDVKALSDSINVLDKWMVARVRETCGAITEGYEIYELDKATRPLEGLIEDISVWYLRRSRERLKGADENDKMCALGTLRFVLKQTSLLMAPVMPFYAEYLYQKVREHSDAESVHLDSWPTVESVHEEVLKKMNMVRSVVARGLELRSRANIKVRQPLPSIRIGGDMVLEEAYLALIRDELNVKHVLPNGSGGEIELDTTLTSALIEEGKMRDLVRAIQDARKKEGLIPQDAITLFVDERTFLLVKAFQTEILTTVGATGFIERNNSLNFEVAIQGEVYRFDIE